MSELGSFFEHAIPILSNRMILRLIEAEKIVIDPFDPAKLGPTAYRLSPNRLRFRNDDVDGLGPEQRVIRLDGSASRNLRPGEYAVVSPRERIEVTEGFVVDFYPSSWCIDRRLVLTAGRLDAHYNADVVLGLYNGGDMEVALSANVQIARASFAWLGEANLPVYDQEHLPQAYFPKIKELRERAKALDSTENQLRVQREQVRAMLAEYEQLLRSSE